MTTMTKILIACSVITLPFTAFAQSADAKYCRALTDSYRETYSRSQNPVAEVPMAIAKCEAGDTATGIPILEKALRDAKVTLPSRT